MLEAGGVLGMDFDNYYKSAQTVQDAPGPCDWGISLEYTGCNIQGLCHPQVVLITISEFHSSLLAVMQTKTLYVLLFFVVLLFFLLFCWFCIFIVFFSC